MNMELFCEKASGWDYSDLSNAAKSAGGVEPFLNTIFDKGHARGLIKGFAYGIVVIVVPLLVYRGRKFYKRSRKSDIDKVMNSNIEVISKDKAVAYESTIL
jgi:hypothetical protein